MTYQLIPSLPNASINTVLHLEDNVFIPFDENNREYQEYLAWLAKGNTPLPADNP